MKIGFIVCSSYSKELKYISEKSKLNDIDFSVMPCTCGNTSTKERAFILERKEELEKKTKNINILMSNSCIGFDNKSEKYINNNITCPSFCIENFVPSEQLNYYIRNKYYIVTSGWVLHWKQTIINRWKFTKEIARLFFNEAANKVLVLDTGIHKNYKASLKEFSEYINLEYDVLPIGISYFENKIQNIIYNKRYEEKNSEFDKYKKETSQRLSEFTMIVDLIPTLSQINSEKLVIKKIVELYTILFAPEKIAYFKIDERGEISIEQSDIEKISKKEILKLSNFETNYIVTENKRGFITKIKFNQIEYGCILAENILFPEYLSRYLNLIQSLIPFFGLLVSNSRQFEELVASNNELNNARIRITESEEKYRRLTENARDLIYRMSLPDGKYEYVSPACEHIWGFSPKDFYETPLLITQTIHPDFTEYFKAEWEKLLAGNMSPFYEYKIITKHNEEKWLNQRNVLIKDENNKPIAIEGIVSDITESKNIEEALKESNLTKDKFFSIIAHDLKGPITSIKGFSELLLRNYNKYDTEKQLKLIHFINQGVNNTDKLLENLLLWSRSQKNSIPFKPNNINLYLIAEETIELLNNSLTSKSIEIKNQITVATNVLADKDMILTVLRNLLSNAIKFTHIGGNISIEANIERDFLKVSIKDNGLGMSKEIQSKIFDIAKNTSTKGTENESGTGLGLILCKEFIERHDGKIWVESEVGKGSIFYFTIPYKHANGMGE